MKASIRAFAVAVTSDSDNRFSDDGNEIAPRLPGSRL